VRTNREKYEYYRAIIEAKDAEAIASLIPSGIPTTLFTIKNYEAEPIEVTSVGIYRRGIYTPDADTRITKDEVALAKKTAEEWVAPTLEDINVHYGFTQTYGADSRTARVSGAYKYTKIQESSDLAWSAEELEPEIARRRELYAPRDGHAPCDYCRKQTPTDSLVSRTIYYRDRGCSRSKVGRYCSDQCGYYDQCGHEG